MTFTEIQDLVVLGNPVSQWSIAACVSLLTFATFLSIRGYLVRALHGYKKTATVLDDVGMVLVRQVRVLYLLFVSCVIGGAIFLKLPADGRQAFEATLMIVTLGQSGLCVQGVIDLFLKAEPSESLGESHRYMASGVLAVARVIVWFTIVMLALDTIGFDVMAAVTTFGIGGIAVALAVQGFLKDMFASFAILLDQPFNVGDFISFDDKSGVVERIGIKTTRLRTLAGEELVLNNADLLESRIHNHRRTGERRVTLNLMIGYEVPTEVLRTLPDALKKVVEHHNRAQFKSAVFGNYTPEGLTLELVYRVEEARYSSFAEIRHELNLDIHELLTKLDVPFGYTTQRTFVQNGRTHRPKPLSNAG